MKTAEQYNQMAKLAAYKITRAMSVFDNEPDHIRQQAEQIVMQRVQMMRGGNPGVIDDPTLIKVVEESAPAPTPEPPKPEPENPETDTPAP